MPQQFIKTKYEPPSITITPQDVEHFLAQQSQKMLAKDSVTRYALGLQQLQAYLAPSGTIRPGTLQEWQRALQKAGYSTSTINLNISVANSLLDFLHRGDLKADALPPDAPPGPVISRAEYLRLLQTARLQGKERAYLLIKLFGTTPLSANDLAAVTVEAVQAGHLLANRGKTPEILYIPAALRQELLSYAAGQGIGEGPIFRSRVGTLYSRTNVTLEMQRIAHDARVSPEKATPRALKKLYQKTMDDINEKLRLAAVQNYEALLNSEQRLIGWEEGKENHPEPALSAAAE